MSTSSSRLLSQATPYRRLAAAMRILLAHSFYRLPGGEDRYVMHQAALLERRHEVGLLTDRNERLTRGPGTAILMIHSRQQKRRVEDMIHEFQPDVVHLHNAYPALGPAVQLAVREMGVPLVMTVHNYRLRCPNGLMFTEGALCRRCERGRYTSAVVHRCFPDRSQSVAYATALWVHRFILRVHESVSLFIGPSTFMRDRLTQWGIPRERTRAILHPVTVLGEPTDPGSFGVFVGRLSTEKGVDVLLRALARVGDPPFNIVGDGPERRSVERLARDLGLSRTTFIGRLEAPDIHRVLEGSRYLVMPSIWEETGGLSALEAMAHARPIIVSALGALTELVRDGAGVAVIPGDPDDLAEKIGTFVQDDELCLGAGRRAWELCKQDHSEEKHLARLEEAYVWALTHAATQ